MPVCTAVEPGTSALHFNSACALAALARIWAAVLRGRAVTDAVAVEERLLTSGCATRSGTRPLGIADAAGQAMGVAGASLGEARVPRAREAEGDQDQVVEILHRPPKSRREQEGNRTGQANRQQFPARTTLQWHSFGNKLHYRFLIRSRQWPILMMPIGTGLQATRRRCQCTAANPATGRRDELRPRPLSIRRASPRRSAMR
jgi:hypothetical protein